MPTPFMHLKIAEGIQTQVSLGKATSEQIRDSYPAFYLGNVAPDYQTICNVRRSLTHFYKMPPRREAQAHLTMFERYPILSRAATLPVDQAVFVAGYCAHLMLDLLWYHEVLLPFFVTSDAWLDHQQRFMAHNALLTYLDKQALESLPQSAGRTLASAKPENWLPFARDEDLAEWRDILVAQLKPGAPIQTVEIYAGRLYMTPGDFAAKLAEPAWMEHNLFDRVPVAEVEDLLHAAIDTSAVLVSEYLSID